MKVTWTQHKSRLSLGLTFQLSRLLGVFPLKLSNGAFVLSKSGLASSFLMVIPLVLNIIIHVRVSSPRVFASQLTEVLNLVQQVAFDASVLSSVSFLVWNRLILSQIMGTLVQLEYAMFRLGIEIEKVRSFTWTVVTLLITWAVFSLDCSSLVSYSIGDVFYIFSHYHLVTLIVLVNAQLSWMAGIIGSGFRCLSTALESSGDLQQLIYWHHRLTSSCRLLSRVYSFEMLILFATSLVSCTAQAYLTFRVLKTLNFVLIVIYAFWTCILYSICFRIIAACVRAENSAMEFDASLYKLIVNDRRGDFSFYGPTYNLYFHLCGKSRVVFSAFGFFQIDWQLATRMIAAGLTYVVILVQFTGN